MHEDCDEFQAAGYTDEDWKALTAFFGWPWLSWVGVDQEVSVSRNEDDTMMLLCGERETSWSIIIRVALGIVNGMRCQQQSEIRDSSLGLGLNQSQQHRGVGSLGMTNFIVLPLMTDVPYSHRSSSMNHSPGVFTG
jgi:hypothetical protein